MQTSDLLPGHLLPFNLKYFAVFPPSMQDSRSFNIVLIQREIITKSKSKW